MKKKIYFIGTLCLLSFTSVNAQVVDNREEAEFGLRGGLNISNVWDSEGQEFDANPKTGFAAGFFIGMPLGKTIGLQPEVLISQKGFTASGSLLGFPYSTTRTTTFLDIPLQIQLKPTPFVTLLAGPQFSYLLNQKDKYTYGSNSSEQEKEFENENIRKNILGFTIGADLSYNAVIVSGRMGWDLQNNHGDGTSSTPRYKNQWLQLTLGFKI